MIRAPGTVQGAFACGCAQTNRELCEDAHEQADECGHQRQLQRRGEQIRVVIGLRARMKPCDQRAHREQKANRRTQHLRKGETPVNELELALYQFTLIFRGERRGARVESVRDTRLDLRIGHQVQGPTRRGKMSQQPQQREQQYSDADRPADLVDLHNQIPISSWGRRIVGMSELPERMRDCKAGPVSGLLSQGAADISEGCASMDRISIEGTRANSAVSWMFAAFPRA